MPDRGSEESWEVLTLCQGLDGQTLPAEEHHVLEGAPICFVCQVVSLDLSQGDEALGHPHKLHIHLPGRAAAGWTGTQPPQPRKYWRDKDLELEEVTDVHELCLAEG